MVHDMPRPSRRGDVAGQPAEILAGPRRAQAVLRADRFIDALVDSGAHKYCEFKAVNQTWMLWDGRAHPVPASRAEVFRDRH